MLGAALTATVTGVMISVGRWALLSFTVLLWLVVAMLVATTVAGALAGNDVGYDPLFVGARLLVPTLLLTFLYRRWAGRLREQA